jgi:nicotinamidase-related amidase
MSIARSGRTALAAAALAVSCLFSPVAPALAQTTIIDEWANVKPPPTPQLKPVTVDPKTTALLMLDFMKQNCNNERRPRCVASLPAMKKLVTEARAKNVMVVYSIISKTTTQDVWPEVAPLPNEPWVQSSADKFNGTELEKILKDKGITTVIAVGTAAQGAVLHTSATAAFRGFKVIVPVDGMSAENLYFEQYTAYHLTNAPGLSTAVTLTKSDMIKF